MSPDAFSPYQALLWVGASPARIITFLVLLFLVAVCAPMGAVVIGCAVWRRVRRVAGRVWGVVRPRTRIEVFGPLARFGPYRMPRREPQHVPPGVLPTPWPADECTGDFAWFERPLTFADFVAECWPGRERGGAS